MSSISKFNCNYYSISELKALSIWEYLLWGYIKQCDLWIFVIHLSVDLIRLALVHVWGQLSCCYLNREKYWWNSNSTKLSPQCKTCKSSDVLVTTLISKCMYWLRWLHYQQSWIIIIYLTVNVYTMNFKFVISLFHHVHNYTHVVAFQEFLLTSIEQSRVTWSCISALRGEMMMDTPPVTRAGSW